MILRRFVACAAAGAVIGLACPASFAAGAPDEAQSLQDALRGKPAASEAGALAVRLTSLFGAEPLKKGAAFRIDGMNGLWALDAPDAREAPIVTSDTGAFQKRMTRLGATSIYALSAPLYNGQAFRWHYVVDGAPLGGGQFELYKPHTDSLVNPNIPHGTVKQMPAFHSAVFPETVRDWWIYTPAQYRAETPAAVMIFQDGAAYVGYVPTMLDNLIAQHLMPVTVAIFVNPGTYADKRPASGTQRSFEYDSLSPLYSRFLLEDLLPEAEKTVRLRHDAASRGVAGISSGGICAFTAAWERPDQFSKVLSFVGSFTNLQPGTSLHEGGHNYPPLIRRVPKKPIRVFLQDGRNDLDNFAGNWPLANQEMAKALAFAGYDYQFVFGEGFHSMEHGRAIMPEALRWLWRGYSPQ